MQNKFAKITIWIVLVLLTLALVLPSILPIFQQNTKTTITPAQLQQIQDNIKIKNISTQPSSPEAERKAAEEKINAIQKIEEEKLKKSSEEADR